MSSNLRVNNIFPSVGTNVAIGTAGGSVTLTGTVSGSSNINVGTGASISSPATNVLTLGTNNAERVRIDSSGNLNLVNTAGIMTAFKYETPALINNHFKSNSTSAGAYVRMYAAAGTGQWDIYNNGANLRFSDNASAGNIQMDRPLVMNSQNIVMSSGNGIDFSATANSSGGTMTSELLNDYEEGTWTPYWSNSTGTNLFVNNDITVFQAFYRKINNMIFYSTYFYSDTSFSYNTGMNSGTQAYVGGLPFVANGYHAGMVGYFVNWSGWDSSGYGFIPMLISESGASTLRIQYPSVGGVVQVTAGTLSASSGAIICSGIYFTA